MFRINLSAKVVVPLLFALVISLCGQSALAQGSSFTYQEQLKGDGQAQPPQSAQASGGNYTMRKQVIGAGQVSSAGSYRLTGTVAEVGAAESDTPRFHLIGGFHDPADRVDSIFCDLFEAPGCP